MTTTRAAFGMAVLVDCHSMPSAVRGGAGRLRPDIVIGDRYGTSCAVELTDMAAQILSRLGYSVSRNKPYAGGHITEHYGRPNQGVHALQIEVKRCLYMDERTLAAHRRLRAALPRTFRFSCGDSPRRSAPACCPCPTPPNRQKKGRSFPRRPKSREETPKEGMRYRYRTATIGHVRRKSRESIWFVGSRMSHASRNPSSCRSETI